MSISSTENSGNGINKLNLQTRVLLRKVQVLPMAARTGDRGKTSVDIQVSLPAGALQRELGAD
jgi:hypothetical protein